jgi:hypothetical protein
MRRKQDNSLVGRSSYVVVVVVVVRTYVLVLYTVQCTVYTITIIASCLIIMNLDVD